MPSHEARIEDPSKRELRIDECQSTMVNLPRGCWIALAALIPAPP